jgi:DNA primase
LTDYLLNKYVNLIGLDGLKRQGNNFIARCPSCKDSSKNKRKKRFYILVSKEKVVCYCHNCGLKTSLVSFLKNNYSNLYAEYKKEYLFGKIDPTIEVKSPSYENLKTEFKKASTESIFFNLLPMKDEALDYCRKRKLPEWLISQLRYTENYAKFVHDSGVKTYDYIPEKDRRIVIPFYDESGVITHIQGRAIDKTDLRYVTIKLIEESPKIWGLDRIKRGSKIRVFEGVFDACFIDNSIALASAGGSWEYLFSKYSPKDFVFILDNDLKDNRDLKKVASTVSKSGVGIFFFPKNIDSKDFNDMIIAGSTKENLEEMIMKNTYYGIEAQVRLKVI